MVLLKLVALGLKIYQVIHVEVEVNMFMLGLNI
jgi:hypothetical protein